MSNERLSPFTTRAVLLSIFFGLFMLFAQGVMGSAAGYFWTGEAALALMIVGYSLSTLTKNPMTPSELGVIFGAVEVITVLFIGWQYFIPSWALAVLSDSVPAEIKQWIPDFLIPKDKLALRTMLVGGRLDLGIWLVPLLFLITFAIVISIFAYFNVIPFQKFYLDKERLIFPVATVASSISKRLREGRETKWIWLGIISGFTMSLMQKGHLLDILWPDFPTASLSWDLTPMIQKVLPGGAFGMDRGSQITPDLIAWAYIIPLEVQASMWMTALVAYLAIPPILVRLGLLPYEPGGDFQAYSSVAALEGPLPWHHISTGLLAAVGVIPLILGSKYIKDSFKNWDGPLAKRSLMVGWVLSFLGSVILLSLLGLSPHIAVVALLLQVVYWHGYVWTIGMGNWLIPTDLGIRGLLDTIFFASGSRVSRDAFWSGASVVMVTDVGSAQATSSLEGFRYSRNVGLALRQMFKAQVMGLVLGSVVGGILLLVSYHVWGAAKEPLQAATAKYPGTGLLQMTGEFGGWNVYHFLVGLGIGALIFLVRGGIPWLTISAVGVLFGLMIPNYALLYLLTTILRVIVDKKKGREFNRRVMIPLMAGFAVGGIFNVMAAGLIKIMKVMGLDSLALALGAAIILAVYLLSIRAYVRSSTLEERSTKTQIYTENQVTYSENVSLKHEPSDRLILRPFDLIVLPGDEVTPIELGLEGKGSLIFLKEDGWSIIPVDTSLVVSGEVFPPGTRVEIKNGVEISVWGVKLRIDKG